MQADEFESPAMSVALRIDEQLTEAGDDRMRAQVIADGFEQFEERYRRCAILRRKGSCAKRSCGCGRRSAKSS